MSTNYLSIFHHNHFYHNNYIFILENNLSLMALKHLLLLSEINLSHYFLPQVLSLDIIVTSLLLALLPEDVYL